MSSLGHYSLSKAIDILGLGTLNLVEVPAVGFEMDVAALKAKLEEASAAGRRVIAIVAVAGTTERGPSTQSQRSPRSQRLMARGCTSTRRGQVASSSPRARSGSSLGWSLPTP